MRLTHIRICGYKHLKKIEFNMSQSSEEVPVDFCVGLMETGKFRIFRSGCSDFFQNNTK